MAALARSAHTYDARVLAMEVACAMCPADVEAARASDASARAGGAPADALTWAIDPPACVAGHAYAGSYAGRNIEKLYARGGLGGSLERAARAVFAGDRRHALVVSGFYVLHGYGGHGGGGGIAAGFCETDGPLGVPAVVRALAIAASVRRSTPSATTAPSSSRPLRLCSPFTTRRIRSSRRCSG